MEQPEFLKKGQRGEDPILQAKQSHLKYPVNPIPQICMRQHLAVL